MDDMTKEVIISSKNIHDAGESSATASEEPPKEESEPSIAVETEADTERPPGVEETITEDVSAPAQETTAQETTTEGTTTQETAAEKTVAQETVAQETTESVEADTTAEENKLCVGIAKEIYEETNKARVAAGLPELEWSDELAQAADIRAEEIIDCFSHVRPDGTKCYALGERIRGENIARGPHASGAEFLEHWMASPGHKENILREQFTMIGVGTRSTEMGDTAVQIFGN